MAQNAYRNALYTISQSNEPKIQKKLKEMILSDYCYICYADLPTPNNADSHYNSARHYNNLIDWEISEATKLLPKKPENDVQAEISQPVNASQTNKVDLNSTESYCSICNIKMFDGHKKLHFDSDFHKKRCTTSIWSEEVNKLTLPDACHICKVKLPHPNISRDHYDSLKHHLLLNKWVKNNPHSLSIKSNIEHQAKSVPAKWYFCVKCQMNLDGIENAELHYQKPSHIIKTMSFYCYICKIPFESKVDMDMHSKSFPHRQIAKFKSDLVSKGISSKEFWLRKDFELECIICKAIIRSSCAADSHFACNRHLMKYNQWLHSQIKDTENLYGDRYFCDICKIPLDGTTNVQIHYQGAAHVINHQKYSLSDPANKTKGKTISSQQQIPETMTVSQEPIKSNNPFLEVIERTLPEKNATDSKTNVTQTSEGVNIGKCYIQNKEIQESIEKKPTTNENNSRNQVVTELNSIERIFPKKDTANNSETNGGNSATIENKENAANGVQLLQDVINNQENIENEYTEKDSEEIQLQNQVLAEIAKIFQTIYISKKIPLSKSLVHLKRFNKEIDDLITVSLDTNQGMEIGENLQVETSTEKANKAQTKIDHNVDFLQQTLNCVDNSFKCEIEDGEIPSTNDRNVRMGVERRQMNLGVNTSRDMKDIDTKVKTKDKTGSIQNADVEKMPESIPPVQFKIPYFRFGSISTVFPLNTHSELPYISTNIPPYFQGILPYFPQQLSPRKINSDISKRVKDIKEADSASEINVKNTCVSSFRRELSSFMEIGNPIGAEECILEKDVFNEFSKIVEKVYYSENLPLDVALICLQNFNERLADECD